LGWLVRQFQARVGEVEISADLQAFLAPAFLPRAFVSCLNIVNLQSNEILFNIKNIIIILILNAPKDSKIFYSWSTQTEQQELLIG